MARVWERPHATDDQLLSEAIWMGEDLETAVLLPSWPDVPSPHAQSWLLLVMARVWEAPAATDDQLSAEAI